MNSKGDFYPNLQLDSDRKETEYIFSKTPPDNGMTVVAVQEMDEDIGNNEKLLGEEDNSIESTSSTSMEAAPERAEWGGKMEFILTCICYAVGLGNVWRFPYLCYKNGGGAFLLPYTIMLALVGLPLFYLELGVGQYASLGPITVWKMNPLLKGLGYASVIVSGLIGLYYNVVITHVLYYLYSSFTGKLPWMDCDNPWNTDKCFSHHAAVINGTTNGTSSVNGSLSNPSVAVTPIETFTPSEEYYRNFVIAQSDSINDFGSIQWHLLICLFISWVIVCLVLLRGIKTLGKVVYFTALFPYVMLTILMIRGVTLPGASQGIIYYLKPDFERLLDFRVWSDAATQIFYSLSACCGGLIAMSSYNKFNNNCYRDSLLVCVINCGTSVYAGFVIFSVLGFMAYEKGVEVKDVAKGGPGLTFEVYPEALARMPIAPLWSVFFFIMMATLGFGSEFSYVECVFSALSDEFPILKQGKNNIIFRVVGCVLFFLLGIPMVCNGGIWLLNIVDYSVGGFPLLVVGIMELICIAWIYGYESFCDNLEVMVGKRPGIFWKICWKYVSPLIIFTTIVLNIIFFTPPKLDGKLYPGWAVSLSWLISLFPVMAIPVFFLYRYCKIGGWELLKYGMKPLPSFHPAAPENRKYFPEDSKLSDSVNNASYNPAFARLMGSTMSTSTRSTDVTNLGNTPAVSNVTISKTGSHSNRRNSPNESKL